MEQTIREMILQADDERNLDLIYCVKEILDKFSSTHNCPLDWRHIGAALADNTRQIHRCMRIWNYTILQTWRGDAIAVKRTYYKDRYNDNKVWEVTKLKGGYYLRQYICGEQFGKGLRTTKKFIQSLGIFDFEIKKRKRCQPCVKPQKVTLSGTVTLFNVPY